MGVSVGKAFRIVLVHLGALYDKDEDNLYNVVQFKLMWSNSNSICKNPFLCKLPFLKALLNSTLNLFFTRIIWIKSHGLFLYRNSDNL